MDNTEINDLWEGKNSIEPKTNFENKNDCETIGITRIIKNISMTNVLPDIMKKSGIYKIVNKVNGNYYIGRTVYFRERWGAHRRKLKKNNHENTHLQNAWNKHGENSFEFVIVEILDKDISLLKKVEDKYISKFLEDRKNGIHDCYNKSNKSGGGLQSENHREILRQFATGRKPSKETRLKLSESAKNRIRRDKESGTGIFSETHREMVRLINKDNCHFGGHHHSRESKLKISNSLKARLE